MLIPELMRILPGTPVVRADTTNPALAQGIRVRVEARAFRRTLPRQILSDVSDVILMVPTFGRNMASPILPASRVKLQVFRPDKRRPVKAYHEDEVDADDLPQLLFQVRKILSPAHRE